MDLKRYTLVLLVLGSLWTSPRTGWADEKGESRNEASESSTSELSWSLGVALLAAPRPYLGAEPRTFPVPLIRVEYERWFVEGIRGGYRWMQSGRWSANVFAQAQFQGLEAADSPFLEGMETRSMSMDGGVEIAYRGRPVGFRFAAISDVLGRSKGQELSLMAISGAPLGEGRLLLFGFGPRWSSANRVDYYYGVRAAEAVSGRPAYTGSDTVSWDLNVTLLFDINKRWSLFALLNREALGSAIRNSPLVDRDASYGMISALSYRF